MGDLRSNADKQQEGGEGGEGREGGEGSQMPYVWAWHLFQCLVWVWLVCI